MRPLRIAAFLLVTVFVGACVDEEHLGSTEQDITFAVQKYLDCTTQDCTQVILGSASDVTCFLAGVVGHINGTANAVGDVLIKINASNMWELTAHSRQVFTTCISATANRIWGFNYPSGTETLLGPASAHRRCFLMGIIQQGVTSAYSNSFYVREYRGAWYVGATKPSGSFGTAVAYGVCVDVPSFVQTFPIAHDAPGTATQFLVSSHNTNNACGLSRLNGDFGTIGYPPPYPGLRIYMAPDWVWTVNEHVGGEATCVSGTPL